MKFLVFSEKVLTKPLRYDIIKKLPQRGGAQSADKRLVEKEKILKNLLTKLARCGIMLKSSGNGRKKLLEN